MIATNPATEELQEVAGGGGGVEVRALHPYGVGIDTHKEFIQVCVLVQCDTRVLRFEAEFKTTWPCLLQAKAWAVLQIRNVQPRSRFADDEAGPGSLRYTIESTGTYHCPVLLAWRGVASIVNPVLAGPTRRKTDVLDARMLAHQAICGLWPASFMPERQVDELRILTGMRQEMGRLSTRSINRVNNHVLRFGHTLGRDNSLNDAFARACVEDMCRGIVPPHECINPAGIPVDSRQFFLDTYALADQAAEMRTEYHKRAIAFVHDHQWPVETGRVSGRELFENLKSVPGCGEVAALTWLGQIGDPRRFASVRQVAAFCGSDPSLKVSAGKVTSDIKRKGNNKLRWVLKNVAAQLVRRRKEPLGLWGFNIQCRHSKGGWGKAINAVARRLAQCLWHVHRTNKPFTYDGYRFMHVPEVLDVTVDQMGLGSRYSKMLTEAGMNRSGDVARSFMTTLPQQKGIGAGCLTKVKEWLNGNQIPASKDRLKGSSSPELSSDEAGASSPTKPPARCGKRSRIASRQAALSGTSPNGAKRSRSRSRSSCASP